MLEMPKYRAFLSYSHGDGIVAARIHHQFETFHIDTDLAGRQPLRQRGGPPVPLAFHPDRPVIPPIAETSGAEPPTLASHMRSVSMSSSAANSPLSPTNKEARTAYAQATAIARPVPKANPGTAGGPRDLLAFHDKKLWVNWTYRAKRQLPLI